MKEELSKETKVWLDNIWRSKQLESVYSDCLHCGKENVEFRRWLLNDGTIKTLCYCPDCKAKLEEERRKQEEVIRQVEAGKTRQQRRETCGIDAYFMDKDFSNYEKGWQDKAYNQCLSYADTFPIGEKSKWFPSLYLWSAESWGTGKTHLSCAILHRILDRWTGQMIMNQHGYEVQSSCPWVIFLSEPELFRRIQATYSFSQEERQMRESEDDIIKSILWADLVVLDDVGKEKRADQRFIQRTIFAIIDGRYKLGLPLILTANLDPGGLREHLESASYDRIFEMIQGKSIRMDGMSFRREVK